MDLTLENLNNKDKEILIIVNPKEIEVNKNKMKKSNFIKYTQISDTSAKITDYTNEIVLKIEIKQDDINKVIYFLDNTDGDYIESGKKYVKHKHDNLKEVNENNTTLIVDEKKHLLKSHLYL